MRRTQCGGCGAASLQPILDLGSSPIANTFHKSADQSKFDAPQFPLTMERCDACGLCQIGYVVPDDQLWSVDDFGFYSSTSAPLLKHFADYARWVMRQDWPGVKPGVRPVVEVGCNDGILLRHFADAGARTLGIDPAPGPSDAARALGLEVVTAGLTAALGRNIRAEYGPAGLVLANNVAAHVADLRDFLAGIAALMDDQSVLVMEVQNLEDLLLGHGFDMLYHEHRFFYDMPTLIWTLGRYGLCVRESYPVDTQGGSLRVVAQLDTPFDRPPRGYLPNRMIGAMQRQADTIRIKLNRLLGGLKADGASIAGYGAPAKATTLLHWTGVAPMLDYVVDTTPAKIGRFMPGTGIQIVGPDELPPPDVYLLHSWNYLPAILRKEAEFLGRGGRFVLPLPVPVVI